MSLFPRAGELRGLQWDDVDLDHAIIHIHRSRDEDNREKATKTKMPRRFTIETKTKMPRRFTIEPALLPLLRTMHDETNGRAFVLELPTRNHLARGFRLALEKAKIDRKELHHSTSTRKAITFHDLRATGLTWMAVRGDGPLKSAPRRSHASAKQCWPTSGTGAWARAPHQGGASGRDTRFQ